MKLLTRIKSLSNSTVFAHLIFWPWNLLFILLLIYSQVEGHGWMFEIIKEVAYGLMPLDWGVYCLLFFTIPIICSILAIVKFHSPAKQLFRLFYGVEVPLMLICLFRLFILRELTGATAQLVVLLTIAMIFFFIEMFIGIEKKSKVLSWIQMITHSCMLLIGVYFGIILAFYAIPLAANLIIGFFQFEWLEHFFITGFWMFLFLIFFLLTSTLFIAFPLSLIRLYTAAFKRKFNQFKVEKNPRLAWIMVVSVIAINIALYIFLNTNQPQQQAFLLLANPSTTIEEKQKIIDKKEDIRDGLLNAYLSEYRYLSPLEKNNHIQELYRSSFNLSSNTARLVQNVYNIFMLPFLYDGDTYADKKKAEELYESFFDAPLQKNEKESIKHAINATWDRDGIEAGLLNIDEQKVLITQQKISTIEHGDWAEIEIYESYQNQTFEQQEIFYYFSLPENAVITGLWLSDNDSIPKKYTYNVSTRGAAQKVYKQQVQLRMDPSLLEQIGPYQYRLRIFPLLPKTKKHNEKNYREYHIEKAPLLHSWFSYKILVNDNNEWELPQLVEKRNVFWNNETIVLINKEETKHNENAPWLPTSIIPIKKPIRQSHLSLLNDSILIKVSPFFQRGIGIKEKNMAFIIDQSYSMHEHVEALTKAIELANNMHLNKKNTLDIYLCGHEPKQISFDHFYQQLKQEKNATINYGSTQTVEMLLQFDSLRKGKEYDVLFMLTDEGCYELSHNDTATFKTSSPLFMVHLGGKLPQAYNDHLLHVLQHNGGNSTTSLENALDQFSFFCEKKLNPSLLAYNNQYIWKKDSTLQNSSDTAFDDIAARVLINDEMQKSEEDNVAYYDKIHAIAKRNGIVSPLSSIIVLVTEAQLKALEEAEKENDRFDREVETGKENTTATHNPFN